MAKSNPITGPYPDGDSRNITLAKSDNPIEPPRSGPAEHNYRDDDAPASDSKTASETVDPASAKKPVGETSPDPAARARADANRPLGS